MEPVELETPAPGGWLCERKRDEKENQPNKQYINSVVSRGARAIGIHTKRVLSFRCKVEIGMLWHMFSAQLAKRTIK